MKPAPGTCSQCGERRADPDETPWLFQFFAWFALFGTPLPIPPPTGRLCGQCAGGYHFLGLLVLAIAVAVGFVLAIVLLA